MKIRMNVQVSSGARVYAAGEIVDESPDKAEEFIRKGFAVPAVGEVEIAGPAQAPAAKLKSKKKR